MTDMLVAAPRDQLLIVMAYIVMAYVVMACIVAYIVMAYLVMAYIVMACTVMAHIVMAHIVMATPRGPGMGLRCQRTCQPGHAAAALDLCF